MIEKFYHLNPNEITNISEYGDQRYLQGREDLKKELEDFLKENS